MKNLEERINKEREKLLELYERNNSFLVPEVQIKSQQLDQLIISYIKERKKVKIHERKTANKNNRFFVEGRKFIRSNS